MNYILELEQRDIAFIVECLKKRIAKDPHAKQDALRVWNELHLQAGVQPPDELPKPQLNPQELTEAIYGAYCQ